ncbi:FUSC family protein [Endozoicomonas arenosclerae]|uniref:FUSC family protein n=1 Tax=Endozoicomonas arenosclerae TaxID=1633495 RepID=UPI0007831DF7|nr:FUSC family protein [Endozoicomonas arenosclerae]
MTRHSSSQVGDLLIPYDGWRARESIKVAVAVAICLVIIFNFQIENGFMALLVITVINAVFPHDMTRMTLERFGGASCGTLLGFLLIQFTDPVVQTCLTVVGVLLLIWPYTLGRLHYASVFAALTLAILYQMNFMDSSRTITFGMHWMLLIAMGGGILWLVSSLMYPQNATWALRLQLDRFLADLYKMRSRHRITALPFLERLFQAGGRFLDAGEQIRCRKLCSVIQPLSEELSELRHLLPLIKNDIASDYWQNLHAFSESAERLLRQSNAVSHHWQKDAECMASLYQQMQSHFYQFWEQYSASQLKSHLVPVAKAQRCCYAILQHCQYLFETGDSLTKMPVTEQPVADLHSLRRAIKITVIILVTAQISLQMHWQGGFQALIAATVMAIQPNAGLLLSRISQRLTGLLTGAAVAVFVAMLLSHITSVWVLIGCYFVGIYFANYFSLGSERYSYGALQAGVALTLTLSYGNSTTDIDLLVMAERIAGLFEGFAIAMIILMLFPDSPGSQYRQALNKLQRRLLLRLGQKESTGLAVLHFNQDIAFLHQLASQSDHLSTFTRQLPRYRPLTVVATRLVRNISAMEKHFHDLSGQSRMKPLGQSVCRDFSEILTGCFQTQTAREKMIALHEMRRNLVKILRNLQAPDVRQSHSSASLSHTVCALLACRDACQNLMTLQRYYQKL